MEVFLGLICSLLLDRSFRGRGFVRALWLLPFMFTPVVVAYQWRWLFNDQSGLINYLLMNLGIISEKLAWLSDIKLAMMSVIVTDIWYTTPFVTLLFLGGLQSLPIEPLESAEVDGASGWQKFWYITLPLLRPVMLVIVLLKTMDAMKAFDLIYIMTYGGPGLKTEMIMTYAYKVGFITFKIGQSSAISVFSLLLMLVASGVIFLLFREKSTITYY
ncbi:MAG: sugar ABC transporter permease [Bacteroidia bacterium]|nr:sugar ABC transporter permease [Bacteroidia bacterium]